MGILVVGPSPPPPIAISLCRADGLGSRRSLAAISTSWPDELSLRRVKQYCVPMLSEWCQFGPISIHLGSKFFATHNLLRLDFVR